VVPLPEEPVAAAVPDALAAEPVAVPEQGAERVQPAAEADELHELRAEEWALLQLEAALVYEE
jgi:hypothetical protein